jgi:hypothetical protein
MNAKITQQINEVIAALESGTEPREVRVDGVLAVESIESTEAVTPLRVICPDGNEARCELARDSNGRLFCIWHC